MIGVLAFQGSFAPHLRALERLGVPARAVKRAEDLTSCDGLILPGGESTVIGKFLEETGLAAEIQRRAAAGDLGLFGTCAGAIVLGREPALAKDEGPPPGRQPKRLGVAAVAVRRNAYGRQIDSFRAPVQGEGPLAGEIDGVFIRAPRFEEPFDARVEVLGRLSGGDSPLSPPGREPVLVRAGRCLLAAFHPELTDDLRIHKFFVEKV